MRQIRSLNQEKPGLERLFGNRKLQIALTLTLGLIVSCSAVAFVSRAHNRPAAQPAGGIALESTPSAGALQTSATTQRGPVQVVRFAIYDVGIYPREAHVAKGLVAVSIEDLSGGSTGLEIERETGNAPERVGRVPREVYARGRTDLRLEPGRYRVYMTDHPANQAVLIVEP